MFEIYARYFIFIPRAAHSFEDGNRKELLGRILKAKKLSWFKNNCSYDRYLSIQCKVEVIKCNMKINVSIIEAIIRGQWSPQKKPDTCADHRQFTAFHSIEIDFQRDQFFIKLYKEINYIEVNNIITHSTN